MSKKSTIKTKKSINIKEKRQNRNSLSKMNKNLMRYQERLNIIEEQLIRLTKEIEELKPVLQQYPPYYIPNYPNYPYYPPHNPFEIWCS